MSCKKVLYFELKTSFFYHLKCNNVIYNYQIYDRNDMIELSLMHRGKNIPKEKRKLHSYTHGEDKTTNLP